MTMHELGSITITYGLDTDGAPVTIVDAEGNLDIVTQLGLLSFATEVVKGDRRGDY